MKFSQSQHWACFSELRRELQGGCGDSAGLSVCVREQNILRWVGGGGWAVNLSSTCSLDSGAWCEVSSGRYPIDHIYYIHHSASLFWQLIAPGKEKGRIGFLFKRRGFFEHEHCLCIFFFLSARGLQREISHWCWLWVPVRNHNSCGMIFWAQFWKVFLREITLMKKNKKRNINGPSILSSVAVWVCSWGLSSILKEQFVFLLLWLISFQ